ncbi:MAG: hypothetical protein OHK0041_21980 [Anaerolineales bacterium]
MKTRLFSTLSLIALLLASCAPSASPAPSVEQPPVQAPASPVAAEAGATPAPSEAPTLPAESAAPTPLPVATSRGPDLHATDPATVNLASGQLQFVEFFRFT